MSLSDQSNDIFASEKISQFFINAADEAGREVEEGTKWSYYCALEEDTGMRTKLDKVWSIDRGMEAGAKAKVQALGAGYELINPQERYGPLGMCYFCCCQVLCWCCCTGQLATMGGITVIETSEDKEVTKKYYIAASGSNDPSKDLSVLQAAAKKMGFVEESSTIWKYAV